MWEFLWPIISDIVVGVVVGLILFLIHRKLGKEAQNIKNLIKSRVKIEGDLNTVVIQNYTGEAVKSNEFSMTDRDDEKS